MVTAAATPMMMLRAVRAALVILRLKAQSAVWRVSMGLM